MTIIRTHLTKGNGNCFYESLSQALGNDFNRVFDIYDLQESIEALYLYIWKDQDEYVLQTMILSLQEQLRRKSQRDLQIMYLRCFIYNLVDANYHYFAVLCEQAMRVYYGNLAINGELENTIMENLPDPDRTNFEDLLRDHFKKLILKDSTYVSEFEVQVFKDYLFDTNKIVLLVLNLTYEQDANDVPKVHVCREAATKIHNSYKDDADITYSKIIMLSVIDNIHYVSNSFILESSNQREQSMITFLEFLNLPFCQTLEWIFRQKDAQEHSRKGIYDKIIDAIFTLQDTLRSLSIS